MKRLLLLVFCIAIGGAGCDVAVNTPTTPDAPVIPVVEDVVIQSFTADSYSLLLNSFTMLRWDVKGIGITCRIDPLIGNVPTVGSVQISPLITTIYSLTCSKNGQGTAVRLITITVR